MSTPYSDDISARIRRLPDREQRRALAYLEALEKAATGTQLIKFVNAFPENDLREMTTAIEDGCERIDASNW